MKAFAFAAVLVSGVSVLSSLAVAKDQCADVKPIKADVAKRGATWTDLSPVQWGFAAGAYAISPPMSVPPTGDSAALITLKDGSGVVLFMDHGRACMPVPVGPNVIKMILSLSNSKKAGPAKEDDGGTVTF